MKVMSPRRYIFLLALIKRPIDGATDFFPPLPDEITTDEEDKLNEVDCPLKCLNNSTCVHSSADGPLNFQDELEWSSDWYCLCSSGLYGNFCENEAERCGDNYCYHGSKCLEIRLEDGYEHVCDCTAAYTEEQYWSGEFCQYPSTVFCTDPGVNGRQFCTNGGSCPANEHESCICPTGFTGPRCAFEIGKDGSDYAKCNLSCQNGGTCQKGQKDLGSYGKFASDVAYLINETHINFEHCVCPPGYFGIRCEYEIEQCEGEFVCLNGGSCEPNVEGTLQCACPRGYDGEHCEFETTLNGGDLNKKHSGLWLSVSCLCIALVVALMAGILYRRRAREDIQTSSRNLADSRKDENIWSGSARFIGSSII